YAPGAPGSGTTGRTHRAQSAGRCRRGRGARRHRPCACEEGRRMNPAKRAAIFQRLREANPHPTTELEYASPFQLLIAVMLSAQATDVGVNKATRRLFPLAGTPQAILQLG